MKSTFSPKMWVAVIWFHVFNAYCFVLTVLFFPFFLLCPAFPPSLPPPAMYSSTLHIPLLPFPFLCLFNRLSVSFSSIWIFFPSTLCLFIHPSQDQGIFCCRGASWTPQTGWTQPRSCCTTSRTPAGPGSTSCVDDACWTPVSTSVIRKQVSRGHNINKYQFCFHGNHIYY